MVDYDDLITFVIKKFTFALIYSLNHQIKTPFDNRFDNRFTRISKITGDISLNCARQFATMYSMV